MPVRHLTQQEVREKLGSGIVLSGIKPPKRLPQQSTSTHKADDSPKIGDGDAKICVGGWRDTWTGLDPICIKSE